MKAKLSKNWPVLTQYDSDHLARIALPLGGIGTGTVSLGGRGDLRDWEIMNRPAKGFAPVVHRSCGAPFFALYAKPAGEEAVTRLLEGPVDYDEYEGSTGSKARNHGFPRFRNCSFAAAYPLGQVLLSDPSVPVDVRIEAFNPLIPGDADRSGIPVAFLRYVLTNRTQKAVVASVCGTVPNHIGQDGSKSQRGWSGGKDFNVGAKENRNRFRKGKGVQGVFMWSDGVEKCAEQWGTMALSTTAKTGVSHRTAWAQLSWGDSLLDFWDDFGAGGTIDDRDPGTTNSPVASLAVKMRIPPKASREVTFLLTWHFPNRQTWTPKEDKGEGCCPGGKCKDVNRVGNYYTTQYADAWDAAEKVAASSPKLEADTLTFVRSFCESDLPGVAKEAALYNLANLRSQTCFRTEDGRFFGFEGCHDTQGCCLGSCTHVWNYEQATAFLFGDLAKSLREVEFGQATRDDGLMSFRVNLPIDRAQEQARAAADGQMGCLMKLYRDWQLSGDDELLRNLWPGARKAIEFCWVEGGWDADRDGVMEGCQHNTMDVEYYGPNPQMGIWYLGALRSAEEMARYLGEDDFADTCRDLFEKGSKWIDANLFNGDYYEHEVRPPKSEESIAEGLRVGMGASEYEEPPLQLGSGCLVDQLVGQYTAEVCGLGYLTSAKNVRKTLRSIMKYNFRTGFFGHFNNMRSYVLGDESALLMGSYPKGRRPKRPFPYANEVMTGFEYSAAVHMLYEGQIANGLKCIQAIRDRYDGRKRSPFNEAECGHHYARAMASWAAVLALTGFHYSAVSGCMTFNAKDGTHFWSNGYAWGLCKQKAVKGGVKVELKVIHGDLRLERLCIKGAGEAVLRGARTIRAGKSLSLIVE